MSARRGGKAPTPFTVSHGITEKEWEALIVYANEGSQERGAKAMGVTLQTFKNHITHARTRMGAKDLLTLYRMLGWLKLPANHLAHVSGDNHRYRIECSVCGERGMIRISVDPEKAP